MKRQWQVLAGVLAAASLYPGMAQAATYRADSDTGIEALDYIENERRAARSQQLTAEQKQLLKDAEKMQAHLRKPLDKSKPPPVAFEGEEMTYDERTGAFTAKGKVDILQMDAHRFQAEYLEGNTKKQEIRVPDRLHVLQMTPGQAHVTLDGYRAVYNYGTKTGSMQDGKGKADEHFISGKRFEFYPDKVVAYEATETRCSAKKPDYQVVARKMTIYPHDKIVMEDIRVQVKGRTILKRGRYVSSLADSGQDALKLPRIGYNNDDGAYLKYNLSFPLRGHLDFEPHIYVNTKDGWRSHYDLAWQNRSDRLRLTYGYFEDSDDKWIKKEPSLIWNHGRHLGHSHFTYNLSSEYGRWKSSRIRSNHSSYGLGLGYDPIKFHRYTLRLGVGYSITRETYDHSRVSGMYEDAVLTKDFNERWAAYAGYHYSKQNRKNSLFDFDTDDFSQKLEGGFSYRVDSSDRLAMGTRYDLDHKKWHDIDYYWFHDLHCAQTILRYRSKQNQWHIRLQFAPW